MYDVLHSESGSGSPEKTIHELVELGKKLRPSSKALKRMSDKKYYKIMENNWEKWIKSSGNNVCVEIAEKNLSPLFKSGKDDVTENKIKLFRVLDEKEIKDGVDDSLIDGVTGAWLSIGRAGLSQGFRCLDYSFPTFNRVVKGARFWVVIVPGGEGPSKLEKLLAKQNNNEPKSGCLGGGEFLLKLSELQKENIEYRTILQREENTVFTFPGAYYYWINLIDFTEVTSKYLTLTSWIEFGKKREVERCSCRKTFTLNWAKIEAEGVFPKITTKVAENGPEGENTKEPQNKGNSEQTSVEDQDGEQISKDFDKVTLN